MSRLNRLAINDEGFIFDPETGNSFTVNGTGLFIIKLLKEGKGEEEILSALMEEYDVSEDEARRDLLDFIEQLRVLGILEGKDV
ncbi:HPr-rel-A system PqqD family peptide chaperone [Phorcysia thermohydrogeniphila]|uniref:PqqD family protein of HPr-rel-A system n=1 Tax=Phorcysia thermohydrogeniphila TaxID=936138 RepID=A0A4R1GJZ9_9BACT|nr:HPr-rel-A system PqqD family peptide chaperone [Phorcysia thermohydrogeniphila]TCK06319.1 PqqD family protein of HPr-rel-A system [Phorcysia thermohydrogeniphila]